ncbi:Fic family protein [Legionella shakespearei]|uniref:Fic/DOC family protein n=1 Tax=Legionella shakespearei DSM 23087 TaxID=1122169 RepID=A0A0W0YZK3_9GAMM|nr:Fic family protein [Legionella shakespearei]KTD62290.1 Fic/DOC family protein [Legionella shakespearei DSM 23087]
MRLFSDLKLFNPALAYTFEPESSPKALMSGEDMNETPFKFGQFDDMIEAYLYAEEVILPWIQEHGIEAITPELLEDWILNIHQRMGKTLLSLSEEKSGEYSKVLISRWHYGSNMMNMIGMYMAKLFNPMPSFAQFVSILVEEHKGLNRTDAAQFLKIMQRIAQQDDAPIHPSLKEKMRLEPPLVDFTLAINRLATAWHEDLLSAEDRKVVEKIVLFVDYPERLPAKMRAFTEAIVPQWKKLNKDDLDGVATFCSDLFPQFTHIHPFPNANGRTAVELMNIVLRSIGLPDILMRKPGDRGATTGSYAEAIACIEKDRAPLKAHLLKCIAEAQTKPFSDPVLEQLVATRMAANEISKQIWAIKPGYDLTKITARLVNYPILNLLDPNNNNHALLCSQLVLAISKEVLTELQNEVEKKKATAVSVTSVSLLKPTYDRAFLQSKMEELSGVAGWKITIKDALSIWRNCASESEAKTIVAELKQFGFCRAEVRTVQGTGGKIVLCDAIDQEKMKTASKSSVAEPLNP